MSNSKRVSLRAIKQGLGDLLRAEARVWFLTEYHGLAARKNDPDKTPPFPGLIFHHELDTEPGSGPSFIGYWESREDYVASRVPLEKWLGTTVLRRASWVRKPAAELKSFWKRISLYRVLVYVAALFGAITALGEFKSILFEQPSIDIQLEAGEPINVLEGAALESYLVFTNQKPNVSAQVSQLSATISGTSQARPLPWTTSSHYIGKSGSIRLPIHIDTLTVAGTYELVFKGKGKSGLLASHQPLSLRRKVEVWVHDPQVQLAYTPIGETRLEVTGLLFAAVAAPNGLRCSVRLIDEPTLRFGPLDFLQMPDWPDPTVSRDRSVSNQSWTTPPLKEFSKIPFTLYIDGEHSTTWGKTREHIIATCSEVNA